MTVKSRYYMTGWWSVMLKLAELRYPTDQSRFCEASWDKLQKYLISAEDEEREFAEGMAAAIKQFDKTGVIPDEYTE